MNWNMSTTKYTSTWENPMVRKMSTDEFIAWRNLYTKRLDRLRGIIIQATFDAQQDLITEEESEEIISSVNEEMRGIIECGRLINQLKG